MRKVIVILIISVFISECSIIRKSGKSETADYRITADSNILIDVQNQNITNEGFFIQKAEIEFISIEGKEKYLASVKFEKPDKYLISVKSRTGIEGARIYISNDSVLANDRMNKKLYSGNLLYLRKRFGLSPGLLPLLFGDVILDKRCDDSDEKCIGNKMTTRCYVNGIVLNYELDCDRRKVITVSEIDNFNKNVSRLKFNDFFSVGNTLIPKRIELEDEKLKTVIKIRIFKVELHWSGIIKFIPGKGYDLIELI